MATRRLVSALAGLVALTCAAAACSTSAPQTNPTRTSASVPSSIVALGDSVPRGTNCDCTPYPRLTADDLTSSTGRRVTETNDSVAGYTTSNVLHQIESDSEVIDDLHGANVVEIEVGANDVAYTKPCGTTVECYAPRIPTIQKNLEAIVSRVHDLASDRKVLVVLLDYWSVWLGGKYAEAKGDAYVAAAKEMTDRVNTVIESTAANSNSAYVDLRAAFKGPDYAYDETHYLSGDGDHPNALGHKQIAAATETVIRNALHT